MTNSSDAPTRTVTVAGTGAIGTAVARTLLKAGLTVTVWNRTSSRTSALVDDGATAVDSVGDAVLASELTLLTVTDYSALDDVFAELDAVPGGLGGRTVVALCTGSAADADRTAARAESSGALYLDAGVQTAPEDIGTPAATILYGGSRHAFDRHLSVLELLSTARHVGENPAAAAVWDLTLFGVWYDAQLGLLRALTAAREAGLDVAGFAETAAIQLGHVVAAAADTAGEVLDGEYPRGPADLREHRMVVDELVAQRAGSALGDGGLTDVSRLLDLEIGAGRGDLGLTAVTLPSGRQRDQP
ncbi:3-hydroxyisobutyrate dehydrogenase-like beta-hydroxyacid dehydrogenase [Haloactinopolyspora alba]|uniref:3-hydroxyisobutyrate dehydrogenase-like beta-hydroxyacid dehydrogenase n=1 Tax=Haloactinopolyspora alba TaxID=648780 RepID=A0A2P8DVR6_9ACTN|nr:NAD(P)-binding domain-containing protein [Haloactinopolyspora alba]PSL01306.1 3-hydroxyisobutyrate dehydrogenase-like beta-hydroxyacid dehydrogenase [Haloactinopolyspora alba]